MPVTHPLFQLFKISILIKQNHQRVPTSGGEKSRAVYLLMSTESENLSSLRSVKRGKDWKEGGKGRGGLFDTMGLEED